MTLGRSELIWLVTRARLGLAFVTWIQLTLAQLARLTLAWQT